jgi:hypothetical protein
MHTALCRLPLLGCHLWYGPTLRHTSYPWWESLGTTWSRGLRRWRPRYKMCSTSWEPIASSSRSPRDLPGPWTQSGKAKHISGKCTTSSSCHHCSSPLTSQCRSRSMQRTGTPSSTAVRTRSCSPLTSMGWNYTESSSTGVARQTSSSAERLTRWGCQDRN